jgi:outer membrane murein-binding lipoprotein Lpp
MRRFTSPRIQSHACVLLILVIVMLFVSITGCVSEQPTNESSSTTSPVSITYTHCYAYNNTSYLTGVIKNVGTQNLSDVSLQAEGYANNTTLERGYAGPQTGVSSTLLPGESAPFMIKMSQTASEVKTTAASATQVASTISKPAVSTKNITSSRAVTQLSTLTAKRCNLRYKIMAPEYKLSKTEPNLLTIANNKTRFSNQTISVSGEIYNGGLKNVTSSLAAVAFYTNDGYVLGVFVSRPLVELGPKNTVPFQIDITRDFFNPPISSVNATRIEEYAYELTS